MKRELTCIVCPIGCSLNVGMEDKKVISVSGNTCPRGKEYAINECTKPMRTVTSTVRCSDGSVVSVRTNKAIPKDKMTECMKIINNKIAVLPLNIGDVIIKDIFGADIIATQNKGN